MITNHFSFYEKLPLRRFFVHHSNSVFTKSKNKEVLSQLNKNILVIITEYTLYYFIFHYTLL